ncbi:hypothetical protein HON86_01365 [Candidatus Woesearchaeota archaeon]|jgi:hypothetical protein|nr:hypothetical protein [Candidatus Woesearchaeota archaeon]MBT4835250.1 hypothetical protein [Candidatus Woesearchaeota archaeon]MBT6735095.1 hypothetical protein [Candidatus Woesearchaeota archaeon]MBT7169928.1 hypothetical protein [Candidatus Woesearchaeota archaeon]MBT7474374.1 hypothetical protein [Candidatus Woesearchaeota archaeon]
MDIGKKGQVYEKEQLKMIFYAFVIIFVVVFIILVFTHGVKIDVETSNLEQHSIVYRLLDSETCIGLENGILNLNNFNEGRLKSCFNTFNGVQMNLYHLNGSEIRIVELNKEMVAQKIVCGLKTAKYDCYDTRKLVIISENGDLKNGFMDFKVITNV